MICDNELLGEVAKKITLTVEPGEMMRRRKLSCREGRS